MRPRRSTVSIFRQRVQSRGEHLLALGLRVEELSSEEVIQASNYRHQQSALSLPDCFALALARTREWTLLTGDQLLRELAVAENVDCHGVLWLLDQMSGEGTASSQLLHEGLRVIAEHPRCRLPRREIKSRLEQYAKALLT